MYWHPCLLHKWLFEIQDCRIYLDQPQRPFPPIHALCVYPPQGLPLLCYTYTLFCIRCYYVKLFVT